MSITNTREIKLVNVGDVTFFHDYKTGYYEVVLELPVSLAVKNTFDLEKIEFSNGARTTAGTGTDTRGLVLQYDRLYKLGQTFFFIDLNNTIHKATSNNILKLFSGHNDKIKEYLNKYRVNFQSKEDLIRLTTFCNQLNADLKKKQ
ncbi:hypothetical protein [Chryseolinea sp. H1M3-3]|uniref:hypothetical protein n=1 Tax=Chryseolinea sp. H1M3-3 TaxID=3034144 RepID=UPI0023EC6704|nr:hypothetical protein [Chryseolinea sp. H1M3-3]